MNEINDTTLLIMGTIFIIPAVYLLMVFKDIKVVIAGLIILIGSQVAVFALHVDPYWHVMALLFFPIIMIGYMTVKIKQRINVALKRIAQIEEEEKQKEREEKTNLQGNPYDRDEWRYSMPDAAIKNLQDCFEEDDHKVNAMKRVIELSIEHYTYEMEDDAQCARIIEERVFLQSETLSTAKS
jgi:hypothetical protein